MKKRFFAALASLCVMMSALPVVAFAEGDSGTPLVPSTLVQSTQAGSALCEHHPQHDESCGYTEGTVEIPCAHEHDGDCYTLVTECVHEHTAECYPAESVSENTATPSQPEEAEPTACTHVCSEESGCITKALDCKHEHDEACGYVPATEGTPCTFVCEVCNPQDSGDTAAPSDAQPEECTCETLCTGDNINGDCPVCGAEGADLNDCKGLKAQPATPSNALPVTALAAAPSGQVLYVGGVLISTTGYWATDSAGNVAGSRIDSAPTTGGYIHYNADNNTLTLHNATIKEALDYGDNPPNSLIFGAAIGVLNQNGYANLTITLEGTNTIAEVGKGIYVLASSTSTGGATLTITGGGSLDASASQTGIWVQSNNGDATLTIRDADVEAEVTGSNGDGVLVQAGQSSNASLSVNGGSLTATGSGNDGAGIQLLFGSGDSGSGTPTVTVSNNAIMRASGNADGIATNSTAATPSGTGIVFDGGTGTVYGSVTLQEDLEIGEGESLTIPDNSSLDTNGNTVTVENGGNLTGEVNSQQPPQITTPPQSQTVTAGSPAVFSVTASAGEGETYQWQQKTTESDSSWTDISGAATASYTIEATTTDMSGTQYRCVVTASGVSVISAPATLTVNEPVTYTITAAAAPTVAGSVTVNGSGTSATVQAGSTVNLAATANEGYRFTRWTSVGGVTFADASSPTTTFTMPANAVTVTANFEQLYTVTVHASAGGTATADKTAAAAGETVNLTATPASGYHFDGWSIVSGTVTIQNNQFIMPAENVEIRAVFDRNSSSGGSGGSSYRDREYEFWMDVKEQIRDADPGDTIKVNARSYDRMPWSVMEALREAEDVTLRITWNGGEDIIIPSEAALSEQSRVYYPLSYLEDMTFEVESEAPAADPDKVNPETGGILEVTAPAVTTPAGEPEVTDSRRGLAETPELAEEGIEQPLPGVYEPEDAVTTSTTEESGTSGLWIAGVVTVLAAAAGGFWFWKRKKQA